MPPEEIHDFCQNRPPPDEHIIVIPPFRITDRPTQYPPGQRPQAYYPGHSNWWDPETPSPGDFFTLGDEFGPPPSGWIIHCPPAAGYFHIVWNPFYPDIDPAWEILTPPEISLWSVRSFTTDWTPPPVTDDFTKLTTYRPNTSYYTHVINISNIYTSIIAVSSYGRYHLKKGEDEIYSPQAAVSVQPRHTP